MAARVPLTTPDGRYLIVEGRLWRRSDPALPPDIRQGLVKELMAARRAVKEATTPAERKLARQMVDRAKTELGERGPVWWTDGDPDLSGKPVQRSPYADWFGADPEADPEKGAA
jgi:hypothetical protein